VLRLLQSDSENFVGLDADQEKSGSLGEAGAHCREGALLDRVETKAGKEKQVAEFLQNALAPAKST